jgi:predicted SAM-dependent methyltransferase
MIKINLGCGKRDFGLDWFHVDGNYFDHVQHHDIVHLPFKDNTVDLIYCSHVIEYLDREEITDVLDKWYNKLKNNGILRLAVPDFKAMASLYLNKSVSLDAFLGPLYGKMTMDGSFIYHKTAYDFNSLQTILDQAGFRDVKEYNWRETEHACFDDHSQAYIPHMEKETGDLISLNMECIK